MKPDENHPFRKLNQHSDGKLRAEIEAGWEESRVRFMMQALGLKPHLQRRVRQREENRSSEPRLTFHAFCEEFEDFPYLLMASTLDGAKLHLDKTAMLPALFRNFRGTPFYKKYEELYDLHGAFAKKSGRSFGLVFKRNGFRQGMCLFDDTRGVPETYHAGWFSYRATARGHSLYLASFDALVEAVHHKGHGWRPDAGA